MQTSAGGEEGLSYADIGARFGISRTHVRALLEDAAQHGDVNLSGRAGRRVELQPSILQAFDHFLADAMARHAMLYKLAREHMAKA
jgi:DNA-binding transcriptional regulator LsrR (DeoR family)